MAACTSCARVPAERVESLSTTLLDVPDLAIWRPSHFERMLKA